MTALSKEEFMRLDAKLDKNQKTIIQYLAEVHYKDPQNPWVNKDTVGAQLGGLTGSWEAEVALLQLGILKLVRENHKLVAISQKGRDYVEFHKNKLIISHIFKKKLLWPLAFLVIIGLLASISTGNFLIFVLTIIGSTIAGLIVFVITKLHYAKGD